MRGGAGGGGGVGDSGSGRCGASGWPRDVGSVLRLEVEGGSCVRGVWVGGVVALSGEFERWVACLSLCSSPLGAFGDFFLL